MADTHKESRVPEWLRAQPGHVIGHFIYDLIKENIGAAALGALVVGGLRMIAHYLKLLPDMSTIAMFLFAFAMFVLDRRINGNRAKARNSESSGQTNPKRESVEQQPHNEQPSIATKYKKPNWGTPPRDMATDANGNTVRAGDLVIIPAWVKKVTCNGPTEQVDVYTAHCVPDHLINDSNKDGTRLNLIANQVEFHKEGDSAEAFSADNILIFSPGPGLFLYRKRARADIQVTIVSPAPVELLYVQAQVIRNSMEVTTLESSKPVAIPKFNPQLQTIGKSLTEKELQDFGQDTGAWFQISGFAKFRGPNQEDMQKSFSFLSAAFGPQ